LQDHISTCLMDHHSFCNAFLFGWLDRTPTVVVVSKHILVDGEEEEEDEDKTIRQSNNISPNSLCMNGGGQCKLPILRKLGKHHSILVKQTIGGYVGICFSKDKLRLLQNALTTLIKVFEA
jgi:hypothetical protein